MINLCKINIEFIVANSTVLYVLLYFFFEEKVSNRRYLSALTRAPDIPHTGRLFGCISNLLCRVLVYGCINLHLFMRNYAYLRNRADLTRFPTYAIKSAPPQRAILFISTVTTFILKIILAAFIAEASVLQLKTGKNMLFSVFRNFM